MNRNPERNQQDINKDEILKDHLFSRIETEWGKNRNDNIVDELAAENPELANELYEFFALLIELELDDDESDEIEVDEDQAGDEKIKNWLETEGLEIALAAAASECKTTTITTTPPTNPSPPSPPSFNSSRSKMEVAENALSEETKTPPSGKLIPFESFARKMRQKHDWGLKETSQEIGVPEEFILFAQNNQEKRYDPLRDVITNYYIEKKGGDRREIRETFNQPLRMVASTGTTTMKQNSYEEMVSKAKIPKSKKKFWLDLITDKKKEERNE